MANYGSEQIEPNPVLCLATRAGNINLPSPLGITRCFWQENGVLFMPHNESFTAQTCSAL